MRRSYRSRRRERADGQAERCLQQTLLLFYEVLHGALCRILAVEELSVQLRRLVLHALQCRQTFLCQA